MSRAAGCDHSTSDVLYSVLDICLPRISSVYTLTRLSSVSKAVQRVCRAHAKHALRSLLLPVLKQAANHPAADKQPLWDVHYGSIDWLCNAAGQAALATITPDVIAVPNVPAALAAALVAAGLRPTFEQLEAAARRQQPGISVWVRAECTQLPPIALEACLGSPQVSTRVMCTNTVTSTARQLCKHET